MHAQLQRLTEVERVVRVSTRNRFIFFQFTRAYTVELTILEYVYNTSFTPQWFILTGAQENNALLW